VRAGFGRFQQFSQGEILYAGDQLLLKNPFANLSNFTVP